MKRPVEAPRSDLGRVPQFELDKIASEVTQSLAAARERMRASAEREETRNEARSAQRAPTNNMGGKSPEIAARLVLENGEVKEIPARRGWGGDSAFIDWLNFTTDEIDFFFGTAPVTDEEVIDLISFRCLQIYGFGITEQRPGGANFYQRSYVLGENCGMVCHGGQKGTVLVMLSGSGCAAAKPGWEKRLFDWLTQCGPRAKITRVDLAHDCYEGEMVGPVRPGERRWGYSVDTADQDYDRGSFTNGGRTPDIEHRGNWKRPNGKGRTVYVGHRSNGKYARVYEKGRELGDKHSPWCRAEVELKAIDRIIPFDVLLKAGEYLAATYPAFTWIADRQERILTTQKKTEITYASMLRWLHRQCGAALAVGLEIEGTAEALLQKISKPGCIPARLKAASYLHRGLCVHEVERETLPQELAFEACLQ